MASENGPWTPAAKGPWTKFVSSRLEYLRKIEDDPLYSRQKTNIAAAIEMYESGQLPDIQSTWFSDGKILKSWPTPGNINAPLWSEVCLKTIPSFHVTYFIPRASTIK